MYMTFLNNNTIWFYWLNIIIIILANGKLWTNRDFNLRRGVGVNECTHSRLMSFCLHFLKVQISDYASDVPGGNCSLQLLAKCSRAHTMYRIGPRATGSGPTPFGWQRSFPLVWNQDWNDWRFANEDKCMRKWGRMFWRCSSHFVLF